MHSHGETNVTVGASADLANVETMTKDANKANNARFTAARSYHFVVVVWRLKQAQFTDLKHWTIIGRRTQRIRFVLGLCNSGRISKRREAIHCSSRQSRTMQKKIGIVNPSTASEPTHLTVVDLKFFADISALHNTLRVAYEQVPSESRHAYVSQGLESWGLSKEQAQLCASNLLTQNVEGSADFARTNALNVMGSWVRGEQEGMATAWLKTMKETWKFNPDLTYVHKIETYEGYSTGPSPYFQSSYSRPTTNSEWGVWAPPDTIVDQLKLFVMSSSGYGLKP